jgi:hypothetical protein
MKKMTRLEAFTKIFNLAKLPSDAVAPEDKLVAGLTGIFFESEDLERLTKPSSCSSGNSRVH